MKTNRLQTLERGIETLLRVASSASGLTVAEIAEALAVHRAIAYRIVGTLAAQSMVHRAEDGRVVLGSGALALAAQADAHLSARARPLLERLARETHATAFLSVAQGADCVAVLTVEDDHAFLKVGYRPGTRHPLTRGAAGLAILAARPPAADEPETVRRARAEGCCVTRGELQRGAVGVASAPGHRSWLECSVGVVAIGELDVARAKARTIACARDVGRLLARPNASGRAETDPAPSVPAERASGS